MLILKYISLIFGSFFIFIYVLTKLRELLAEKCDQKIRYYIKKFTNNYHISFLLGIILTLLLTSSNAVTVILIAFLAANLINTKSALAILLGSNIGTTITVFLFSFDIGVISIILIITGLILKLFKRNNISLFFIYLGILFYTLIVMSISFDSLSDNIKYLFTNSNLLTMLEGALITTIINSSSTTIISAGMLFSNNTISLQQAISLMLGANIGTTIATYLYTINQNKKVKKVILYNIIFNIFGAILFLIFIDYFIILLNYINFLKYPNQTIALSHLTFNLLTTIILYIILIPFKFSNDD